MVLIRLSPGKAEGFYRRKRDVSRKTIAITAVDSPVLF
jgi:hypothetical protein